MFTLEATGGRTELGNLLEQIERADRMCLVTICLDADGTAIAALLAGQKEPTEEQLRVVADAKCAGDFGTEWIVLGDCDDGNGEGAGPHHCDTYAEAMNVLARVLPFSCVASDAVTDLIVEEEERD